MLLAESPSLRSAVDALRERRPSFHSEADFQHALTWQIRLLAPTLNVRLETHTIRPGARLDLLIGNSDWTARTAVELKYLTAKWTGVVDGEQFDLADQLVRRYDADRNPGSNGAVIVVSNADYWSAPSPARVAYHQAFRIHEDVLLQGTRCWDAATSPGTMKGRENAIELRSPYSCRRTPFSDVNGRNGKFRVLVIEVDGLASPPAAES